MKYQLPKASLELGSWGSSQYSTANATFYTFINADKGETMEELLKKFKVPIFFKSILTKPEVEKKIKKFIAEIIEDNNKIELEGMDDTYNKLLAMEHPTIKDCFDLLNESAWDLWSAAPILTHLCFEELNMNAVPKAKGFGPMGNKWAQSENYQTGVACWMLCKAGFIDIAEADNAYSDFDT